MRYISRQFLNSAQDADIILDEYTGTETLTPGQNTISVTSDYEITFTNLSYNFTVLGTGTGNPSPIDSILTFVNETETGFEITVLSGYDTDVEIEYELDVIAIQF